MFRSRIYLVWAGTFPLTVALIVLSAADTLAQSYRVERIASGLAQPTFISQRPVIRRTLFTIPPASRREPGPAAVSAPSTTWGAFFATT